VIYIYVYIYYQPNLYIYIYICICIYIYTTSPTYGAARCVVKSFCRQTLQRCVGSFFFLISYHLVVWALSKAPRCFWALASPQFHQCRLFKQIKNNLKIIYWKKAPRCFWALALTAAQSMTLVGLFYLYIRSLLMFGVLVMISFTYTYRCHHCLWPQTRKKEAKIKNICIYI
jgi:hypothetical protein